MTSALINRDIIALASLPMEESEKAIAGEPEGEHHSGFLTLNVQLPEMQEYA